MFANMWDTYGNNKQVGGIFPNDEDGHAWGDEKTGAPALLANRAPYGIPKSLIILPFPRDRRFESHQAIDGR